MTEVAASPRLRVRAVEVVVPMASNVKTWLGVTFSSYVPKLLP